MHWRDIRLAHKGIISPTFRMEYFAPCVLFRRCSNNIVDILSPTIEGNGADIFDGNLIGRTVIGAP